MPYRKISRLIFGRKEDSRLKKSLRFAFSAFIIFLFAGMATFIFFAKDLPRPEKFTESQIAQSTKIYDRTGQVLLYDIYGNERRTSVSLSAIPNSLKNAILTAEDANFYHHFGVDLKSIARSILINLKIRKPIYGGSTVSQQLIRSTFLTTNKTLSRKIKELVLTLELERRYPKDQILEWYLNQVPLGGNIYGVEAASQTYFRKSVSELSLEEAALLASLIKAPSYLSPSGSHQDELLARKDYILGRMAKLGLITEEEAKTAKEKEIQFSSISQSIKAPHFVMYVKDLLEQKYGEDYLKIAGLKVYTSLDWNLQEFAEKTVEDIAESNEGYHAYNTALVSINPKTGEILSMIGSKNWFATESYPEGCTPGKNCFFEPKFNAATGTSSLPGRQPGSAFKPLAYSVAFEKGYTPNTILVDEKTEFNPNCDPAGTQEKDQYGLDCYHPENYDGKFRGQVTVRQALAQSLNIPSVKVLAFAGVPETIELAQRMGITTLRDPSNYGFSLVLGGGEVKLLDITSAYGIFATEGLKTPPTAILKVEDNKGNIIEENKKTPQRVLEANITREISDILSDNETRAPIFGRNSPLYFPDYQVAVKTGTTQDFRDGWAIGYTPSIVTGVWVGNNDNSPMAKEPGVVLAGPIFHRFMENALSKLPKESFQKPSL